MTGPFTNLRRLYSRPARERADELIEGCDSLAARLQSYRLAPTAAGAEGIAAQIHGLQRAAGALVEAHALEASQ